MFIDLSRISPEGLDLALPEAELDVGASDGTWEGPARVSADLHVARSGHDFLITGTFTGRLNLLCGRCLERFQFRAEDAFNLFCPVAATAPAAEEHELAEDDLDVTYVEEGKLNTDQLLRESLLLSLPVQPLCRDDCRGLCPRCGADQNQGPCDCAPVGTDPRLQVLKKLL
ncbi:MAG: DUF177 domain-containing protein [Acidobacteria bacterium]|nr:MAG: DUF177 domain-containing protein [Acidobacteriota bacterium]